MASSPDPRRSAEAPTGAAESAQLRSELERLRRRLELAEERVQRKERELQQFLYTVSHDLRSPLVTIVGFLGILAQDLHEGRTAQNLEVIERVRRAGQRMSRLLEDLVQLSRIGSLRLAPTRVDVTALVRGLLESELGGKVAERGARVEVQEGLPRVLANREALARVFQHLLANALEHGDPAPERPIEVGGEVTGEEARFFVRDQGPGIRPEHRERVFGAFQTLRGAPGPGTGIGLALVARILEVHGGKAWIEPSGERGATFWISLPLVPATED